MVPILIAGGAGCGARTGQAGFGVRWTVQVLPFQRSAMVWFCVVPSYRAGIACRQPPCWASRRASPAAVR